MNSLEPILYVGGEPEGKYAQGLKLLLAELMQRRRSKNKNPFLEIKSNGCWEWLRGKTKSGYGRIRVNWTMFRTHRYFYENLVGPIPKGLEPDHLCRNRACFNPEHIEPVTPRVNQLRSFGVGGLNFRKTNCPQGHPYSGKNLLIRVIKSTGGLNRQCRECRRVLANGYRNNKLKNIKGAVK